MTVRRALRALLPLLLAAAMSLPGRAVLCVAGPSHVALEPADSGGCHPERGTAEVGASWDGCPPDCADLPLGGGPAIGRAREASAFVALAPQSSPGRLRASASEEARAATVAVAVQGAAGLPSRLRSTVLLC